MSLVAERFGGKVKAAGGIRSFSDAVAMIEAGAYPIINWELDPSFRRLGTSSGVTIMESWNMFDRK